MSRPATRLAGRQGVALILVLWIIMVLSLLISGFAFTMHVETQVAGFSRKELKAEMLARSGIEVARMQLLLHDKSPTDAGFDALSQEWVTNQELYVDHELGEGKFNVVVTDEERKLPVNNLTAVQWHKLLDLLGVDPLDADVIVDSTLDWIDPNDLHRLNGADNSYYGNLIPPYRKKGGPMDRIEEMLMIRGVTKELFDGVPAGDKDSPGHPGLKDLLTTFSAGQVNVNTASTEVLQALLNIDDTQATVILQHRDGQDGVPGTDDDMPFRSVGEFLALLSGNAQVSQQYQPFVNVSSQFFHVKSTGEVAGSKYTIDTVLHRQGGTCLVAAWHERRGGQ